MIFKVGSMIAITSYYNPLHGQLRRRNYKTFRRHLDIPLITVEWSRDAEFELGQGDAEYLIQLSGGDLLWQKERLLNIGLGRALELGFEKVAFLDSDIVFEDPKWHEEVSEGLDNSEFIQCFQVVNFLLNGNHHELLREALFKLPVESQVQSLMSLLAQGQSMFFQASRDLHDRHTYELRGNPGMAIAVNVGKLIGWKHYEGNIVGGGDTAMLAAMSGNIEEFFAHRVLSSGHRRDLLKWVTSQRAACIRTSASSGRICHLWHGLIADRQYSQRHFMLANCEYDPAIDLDMESPGPLRFIPDRYELKQIVASYIGSRKDG